MAMAMTKSIITGTTIIIIIITTTTTPHTQLQTVPVVRCLRR